jgi:hypothetical protein
VPSTQRALLVITALLAAVTACDSSVVVPAPLNPARVPLVAIGFEGQTDTFPSPGGIVPVLVRAVVSEPSGRDPRSWSADPQTLANLQADAVGYGPPGALSRFGFSVGDRMLNAPVSGSTTSSPGVEIVATPGGGTLAVDRGRAAKVVWVEISVVFDDEVGGQPARIDGTCGFWLYLT